jgi:hypothetical protein
MQTESIVVMECGSRWPSWVDRQAGSESNVAVVSQQPDESQDNFTARALAIATSNAVVTRPARAVLVCSADAGTHPARHQLLLGLVRTMADSGGGQVVLVADGSSLERLELATVASELNAQLDAEDVPVTVTFRAAPRFVAQSPSFAAAPQQTQIRRVA